jgi:diadenylate cyclase
MSAQELLSRAAETLRIIEKHKEIFSELLLNLNVLEFTSLVSLSDVMLAVQRAEMVSRIAAIIKRYIVELGTEGNLVKMQLKELVKGIDDEELLILKDYIKGDPFAAKVALSDLSLEELIESSNILNALGYQKIDDSLITKGYRILGKTSLSPDEIQRLIDRFGNLQAILDTSEKLMLFADERKARSTHRVLSHLKEQVMLGKKI